jgi:hypothetical protein
MATLAQLGSVSKSQIGIAGKYVRAVDMTAKQRSRQLRYLQGRRQARIHKPAPPPLERRSNLTAKQRLRSEQLNQGAAVMASRPKGVHGAREGFMMPEGTPEQVAAVRAEAKRQGIRKPISVSRRIMGPFGDSSGVKAIAANVGSKRRGGVVIIGGENVNPYLLTHEMAHLSPKKSSAARLMRMENNPQKFAREEARADAVAIRRHGKIPLDESGISGTAYEASARSVAHADRGTKALTRMKRNTRTAGLAAARTTKQGFPHTFTPRQARTYTDVRRRMGTWEDDAPGGLPTAIRSLGERAKRFGAGFRRGFGEQ